MRHLVLFFSLFALLAWADTEPNNTCNQANEILVNSTTNGSVDEDKDEYDFYSFTSPGNGTIEISVNGSHGELEGLIYDSKCKKTKFEDKKENPNIYLNFDVKKDTTYKLRIKAEDGEKIKYTLQIIFISDTNLAYCASQDLQNGFHIINPFGSIDKSFEIFCHEGRDYIALPNKNEFNNFVFNANSLTGTDYYNLAQNQSRPFNAIEINANTMEIVPSNQENFPQTIGNFRAMGKTFSSINLIGTPFAIDWDSDKTTISNCNKDKLRKGYFGQTVKINTLNYDKKAICQINVKRNPKMYHNAVQKCTTL